MVQPGPPGSPAVDIHHIKAIEVARPAVPEAPDLRHPPQRLPLPPANSLTAPPEGLPPPRLHFDEGDECAAADHQVQFIAPDAEAVGLDIPAGITKMNDGQLFPLEAESVAGVGPLIGRDGSGG